MFFFFAMNAEDLILSVKVVGGDVFGEFACVPSQAQRPTRAHRTPEHSTTYIPSLTQFLAMLLIVGNVHFQF